jgi:hypothetical protein
MLAYHNESTSACGATIYLNASMVPMDDRFHFKQEFHIIIQKHKDAIISSLSEHPCPFHRFHYKQIYTLLSCITGRHDFWLLLQMANRNSLQYISDFKKRTLIQLIILKDIQMSYATTFLIGIQHSQQKLQVS